jgi:hypothetical protein
MIKVVRSEKKEGQKELRKKRVERRGERKKKYEKKNTVPITNFRSPTPARQKKKK